MVGSDGDWAVDVLLSQSYVCCRQVLDGPVLELFRAEELEVLVCGTPELDFLELEKVPKQLVWRCCQCQVTIIRARCTCVPLSVGLNGSCVWWLECR